jgi:hypothetical protein
MIKRIIGTLFTLATLAVVVFAVLNYPNYKSMLFERDLYDMLFVRQSVSEPEELVEEIVNENVIEQEEPSEEATEGEI